MVPMSSTKPIQTRNDGLTPAQKKQLLKVARDSIEYGLKEHKPLPVNIQDYAPRLQETGCCFVTLTKKEHGQTVEQLRGCIGSLKPYQALLKDVADHAHAAAFEDSRFSPVSKDELALIHIDISVLTPQTPIPCNSEQELLENLVACEDGLTIEAPGYHATFLPAVWEKLPNKQDFLQQLKLKAGMPLNFWSEDFNAFRYHTVSFGE